MVIKLSRRNLLSLLHKLEMTGSKCSLVKPGGIIIQAETDEVHYADRKEGPGPMHPETETFVSEMQEALEIRHALRLWRRSKQDQCCGGCKGESDAS